MDLKTVIGTIEGLADSASNPITTAASDPNIFAQWVMVTPELARWLLDNANQVNRKKRRNRVNYYRDAMENDEWELNGDTFVIDCFGQLVNGQHRLQALADSGMPQEALFVYGVQPRVRFTTDDSFKRQFRDDLMINGVPTPQYKDKLTRFIAQWDIYAGLANTSYRTNRKHLGMVFEQNREAIQRAGDTTHRWRARWPGNMNALTFTYWLLTERVGCDRRLVDTFFSILSIGSQSPEDEMLVKMTNRIKRHSYIINGQVRHEPSHIEVYWLIRAWNYWVSGETAKYYVSPQGGITDPYPMPILVKPETREPIPEVIV